MNELEKLKEIERVRGASELTPLEWAVWVLGNIGNIPKAEQAAADLARLKREAEVSLRRLEDLTECERKWFSERMEVRRLQVIEAAALEWAGADKQVDEMLPDNEKEAAKEFEKALNRFNDAAANLRRVMDGNK